MFPLVLWAKKKRKNLFSRVNIINFNYLILPKTITCCPHSILFRLSQIGVKSWIFFFLSRSLSNIIFSIWAPTTIGIYGRTPYVRRHYASSKDCFFFLWLLFQSIRIRQWLNVIAETRRKTLRTIEFVLKVLETQNGVYNFVWTSASSRQPIFVYRSPTHSGNVQKSRKHSAGISMACANAERLRKSPEALDR